MVTLEEATKKAKEYLDAAGFPQLGLRLCGISRDDRRNQWSVVFEFILQPTETLLVEIDAQTGEGCSVQEGADRWNVKP